MDWHLPRHAEQWATLAEAQRDGLDYARKLIDEGVLNVTPSVWNLAA
jgi:hypothetical protein